MLVIFLAKPMRSSLPVFAAIALLVGGCWDADRLRAQAFSSSAPSITENRTNRGPASNAPHPAVCRVQVPQHDGVSYGSGTLVAVQGKYGFVVTNWHVVEEPSDVVTVTFPDGFQSGARVLKLDQDWDLAALIIWRPNAQPVPISTRPPQPGDWLMIAGYGPGPYRAAAGRCTQYVSPGVDMPFEMVELSAKARQGDSGGPIFNDRGELAGVLFGTGQGRTAGSYAGRVGTFLASIQPDHSSSDRSMIASAGPVPSASPGTNVLLDNRRAVGQADRMQADRIAIPVPPANVGEPSDRLASLHSNSSSAALPVSQTPQFRPVPPSPNLPAENSDPANWVDYLGRTPFDWIKTVLAAVGVCAVFARLMKRVG